MVTDWATLQARSYCRMTAGPTVAEVSKVIDFGSQLWLDAARMSGSMVRINDLSVTSQSWK